MLLYYSIIAIIVRDAKTPLIHNGCAAGWVFVESQLGKRGTELLLYNRDNLQPILLHVQILNQSSRCLDIASKFIVYQV